MPSSQAHTYVKPNLAERPITSTADAQDLMLHANDHGSTFMYVEQRQGAMLSGYDVTHPERI